MISRSIEFDGNLLPSVVNITSSIPEVLIFNKEYYLRHPKIIINISLKRVFNAFNELLELAYEVEKELTDNQKGINPKFDKLSYSILELMNSINSFIEDCFHVFKCTTPYDEKTKKIKEVFVNRWLNRSNHPTYKSFYNSIKEYKDEISFYINNFKHEHGRIDIIAGHFENNYALGYTMRFIDDTPDGAMEILDLNKVKSIFLDIKYHFYNLYKISDSFSKELLDSINVFHSKEIKVSKTETTSNELENILQNINYNDLLIFPNNELFTPKVYINHNSKYLEIKYPFGITKENTEYIKLAPIEGKPYPDNSLIIIPTNRTITKIQNFLNGERKSGDKLTMSLDDSEDYLKVFVQNIKLNSDGESYNYIELNYDNLFKIKSFTNIKLPIIFESGIHSDLHVKIFDVEYLGIKMSKN